MEFTPLGLVVSLGVLGPNFLLLPFPPRTPIPEVRVPVALRCAEWAGQASCLVVPAVVASDRLHWWWALPAGLALVGYYALWARYLVTGRDLASLYRSAMRIPVPMAVLPVLVFGAAAAWLESVWLAAAVALLAVGHIPSAVITARAVATAARPPRSRESRCDNCCRRRT